MLKIKHNQTCYTLNGDGTLEKWYFSASDKGLTLVKKSQSEKFTQVYKYFPDEEIYYNRQEALAALKNLMQSKGYKYGK